MVDLENTTRSPPTVCLGVGHHVDAASTRLFGAGVVGDSALEEDWGRQFGGVGRVSLRWGLIEGQSMSKGRG